MYFSKKDKSLLLLICAALVVLWLGFSVISKIFYTASFKFSDVNKITQSDGHQFNVAEKITASDLKDRAILLHFWNRSCISCLEALPTIKNLESELGSKLTVIGIYSSKFENEKDLLAIKNAILKYDINHLIISDPDLKLWNEFEVKAWPTFILINPNGREYERHEGIKSLGDLSKDTIKMVSRYRYQINREPLAILPEKFNVIGNVLNFPSKLEYSSNFIVNNRKISAIFIANSGENDIAISSLAGGLLFKIGQGSEGFVDGNFDEAKFRAPQGILFSEQKLYIADTGNHALRLVDFDKKKVSTLIGNGNKGEILSTEISAEKFNLSSPTDIEFFPDKKHIIISNAGSNQILSYDLENNTIKALAGNGESGNKNGKYPNNSLAQTSDMVVIKDKIYFLDALSSSLRVLEKNGEVKTLANSNLQNPLALTGDENTIYIADSFNNRIQKYSPSARKLSNLIGAEIGNDIGKKTRFNSPEGIIGILGRLYISDSNNNRIIVLNKSNLNSEILDVIPPLKLPKEGFLEYLPNLQKSEPVLVKANEKILLKIDLNDGWKINESAPSFINLLQMNGDDKADLITSFDWHFVKQKEMFFPAIAKGKNYLLQGSIYYCEDKKNALCFVKSYEQKISAVSDEKNSEIEIKLGY